MKSLTVFMICLSMTSTAFTEEASVAPAENEEKVVRNSDQDLDQAFEYIKNKKFDEALMLAEKAISENPDYWRCYWTLGQIYIFTDKAEEALPYLEKAEKLGINPKVKQTHEYLKAGAYVSISGRNQQQGNYDDAEKALKTALNIAQENKLEDLEEKIQLLLIKNTVNKQGGTLVPNGEGGYFVMDPWGNKSMVVSPKKNKD